MTLLVTAHGAQDNERSVISSVKLFRELAAAANAAGRLVQ